MAAPALRRLVAVPAHAAAVVPALVTPVLPIATHVPVIGASIEAPGLPLDLRRSAVVPLVAQPIGAPLELIGLALPFDALAVGAPV